MLSASHFEDMAEASSMCIRIKGIGSSEVAHQLRILIILCESLPLVEKLGEMTLVSKRDVCHVYHVPQSTRQVLGRNFQVRFRIRTLSRSSEGSLRSV